MVSSNTSKRQVSCCHFAQNRTPLGYSLEATHEWIVSSVAIEISPMSQNASRFIYDL